MHVRPGVSRISGRSWRAARASRRPSWDWPATRGSVPPGCLFRVRLRVLTDRHRQRKRRSVGHSPRPPRPSHVSVRGPRGSSRCFVVCTTASPPSTARFRARWRRRRCSRTAAAWPWLPSRDSRGETGFPRFLSSSRRRHRRTRELASPRSRAGSSSPPQVPNRLSPPRGSQTVHSRCLLAEAAFGSALGQSRRLSSSGASSNHAPFRV